MNSFEVLAPAGSMESIIPAVRLGADAIYLGAQKFSARANAKNFDNKSLYEVVEYCHSRDVKVYLVVNTLVKDAEINAVLELVRYACSLPVDALIVQDLGLISLIKEFAPEMRIHGSTQMSVHTPSGAQALHEMGLSRVVLARELSRDEIIEISQSTKIELEVFVHGALCMSVSGQCYLSAMIGGRSGNRGLCAQPCRLPFSVRGGTGHDLSLKDLSLIDYIQDIKSLGVTSVKIEGRMKRPEYVAAATKACKTVSQGQKCDESLKKDLESVFSRSGFTDGYYKNNRGRHMFGVRSKEDVMAAKNSVFSKIRNLYKDEPRNVPVCFNIKIKNAEKLTLKVCDSFGHECSVEGDFPEKALNFLITDEKCVQQLQKTGGTPFFCENIVCDIDDGLSVPISSINNMRRDVLKKLESVRAFRRKPQFLQKMLPEVPAHSSDKVNIRARFPYTDVPDVFKSCELIYVPLFSNVDDLKNLIDNGFNVAVEIPRGMFGRESQIAKALNRAANVGIRDVLAGNIGAVKLANDLGFKVHGSFSLNVTNSFSLKFLEDLGVCDAETSFELTYGEINSLRGKIKRGAVAYGRLPLMLMRNCPIMNETGKCKSCKNFQTIRDRKNVEFPVMCEGGCAELLNSVPLYLGDKISKFKNLDFFVLRFTVENSVESGENFLNFNKSKMISSGFTRGLYARGVD